MGDEARAVFRKHLGGITFDTPLEERMRLLRLYAAEARGMRGACWALPFVFDMEDFIKNEWSTDD